MPRPKIIRLDLQGFEERTGKKIGGQLTSAPLFEFRGQLAIQRPAGGEREPALGMIGGSQRVKMPKRARQDAIGEFIAFAPPLVPDAPQISVRARLGASQFGGQQTAQ